MKSQEGFYRAVIGYQQKDASFCQKNKNFVTFCEETATNRSNTQIQFYIEMRAAYQDNQPNFMETTVNV
jgi:hypothetical protein